MKSRMESARARPDGPVVRLAQSIVMDIYCLHGFVVVVVGGVLWCEGVKGLERERRGVLISRSDTYLVVK